MGLSNAAGAFSSEVKEVVILNLKMKQLIYKLIVPLTIISLAICTKEWYVLPVDAPHSVLSGFPLPYVCNGWHTSLSYQYFLVEFIIDCFVYFLFWFSIIMGINRFVITVKMPNFLTKTLLATTIFIIGVSFLFISNSDNLFYLKRDFDIEIIKTNYICIWEDKIDYHSSK